MLRITLILAIAAGLAVGVAGQGTIPSALACTGGGFPTANDLFGQPHWVEENLGLAVLGQVISEHRADPSRRGTFFQPNSFISEVRIELVLAGSTVERSVTVGPTNYTGPDCSGGPRLLPGEKFILFLSRTNRVYREALGGGPADSGEWQTGGLGTPILFDGDDAYFVTTGRFSEGSEGFRERAGSAAEVLSLALDFAGASDDDRARAFQFVLGTRPPTEAPPSPPITPPSAGDAGLVSPR